MRFVPPALVLMLTVACAPPSADEPPAPPADEVAQQQTLASHAWPERLQAAGRVTQTVQDDADGSSPVVTPVSGAEIRYEWPLLKMVTSYHPACPALLTAISGSDHPCSYFFQDDDVYYVYRDQQMTPDPPDPDHDRCCIIEDFSLLSPHFPDFVDQYDEYMSGQHAACTPAQLPKDLPASAVTPGTPGAGFYAYDPQTLLTHGGQSWAMPLGFGGGTPNDAFTSVVFDQAVAFPEDIAELALPEICQGQDVPQCMDCAADGTCSESLTDLFGQIKSPGMAGCVLCHNRFPEATFPQELLHEFQASSCGAAGSADGEALPLARSW